MKKLLWLPVYILAFFSFNVTSALAEGYALYEYSARGIALGGATMARRPDPSAIAVNPSLIARLDGQQVLGGFSVISPSGKMKGDSAGGPFTTALKDSNWVVPHAYYTHKITDRVTFGVGEFSRFGLGFEYPRNWPGRFNIYEVALATASVSPVLAAQVTDKFSIGVGLEIMYATLDMRKRVNTLEAVGVPGEIDSNIQDADDFGAGFNLSGHYQFNDQWGAGLVFRSPVSLHCKGDVDFTTVSGPVQFPDGPASGRVTLPMSIGGGVAWTPIPDLSIETGFIWTRWSSFDALDIKLPAPLPLSENPKAWKNSWRLNVGVEYDLTDWMTVRAGYVYDQSPMTEQYEDYLVPTDGRNIYSAGLGFNYESWTVDLAYAYIDAKGRSYQEHAGSGTHVLPSKAYASNTDIFSVSVGYKF